MPRRRLLVASAVALIAIVGLTAILERMHPAVGLATALLLFLLIVVVAAMVGGAIIGIATAVVSVPVIAWFVVEPVHTFEVHSGDVAPIGVFLVVSMAISVSIELVNRRSAEVRRARDEAAELTVTAARAEAAAEGDRLRTAILRAVSHDLRTPLASIKASATSLLQDDIEWTPDARREFLLTIDEETDRLDRIVGDLLDMSRLDAGVVRPDLTAVDLVACIHVAIAGLDDAESVDVVTRTPVQARADEVLVERVVANLVANALHHGGGAVEIEVAEDAGAAVVRVVDHGPGMAPEDMEAAFEPFRRLGDRETGTGLGLAVARGFVDAMDGSLRLTATPGGGLTAVIRLASADARGSTIRSEPEVARR